MAELSSAKIEQYLKVAKDLEVSVYTQTQAKKNVRTKIEAMRLPTEPNIPKPIEKILQPTKEPFYNYSPAAIVWLPSLFAGMAVLFIILTGSLDDLLELGIGILLFIVALFSYIYPFIRLFEIHKDYKRQLAERDYQKQLYLQSLDDYEKSVKAAKAKYEADCNEINRRYRQALQFERQMERPLNNTNTTLSKLYNLDFLFPKYRNLIAVCTIYEYFATGRCNTLTGPDGAYNLYESELRQNLIINKLDTIISQLDRIKDNQYTLFTELQKSNIQQEKISRGIQSIINNTDVIAANSTISAYCSQITAVNTSALTAMELF